MTFPETSRMSPRGFIYRVLGRAPYRRDEFALYVRRNGWMYYVLPNQAHLCGRKGCC